VLRFFFCFGEADDAFADTSELQGLEAIGDFNKSSKFGQRNSVVFGHCRKLTLFYRNIWAPL